MATSSKKKKQIMPRVNPVLGAVLLGSGAAFISMLIWYVTVVLTRWQIGIMAVAVGFLIGKAVVIGAGYKKGRKFQFIGFALTLISMFISEYMIERYYMSEVITEIAGLNLPLPLLVASFIPMTFRSLIDDPLTLLFWGIALWEAFKIPEDRSINPSDIKKYGVSDPNEPSDKKR